MQRHIGKWTAALKASASSWRLLVRSLAAGLRELRETSNWRATIGCLLSSYNPRLCLKCLRSPIYLPLAIAAFVIYSLVYANGQPKDVDVVPQPPLWIDPEITCPDGYADAWRGFSAVNHQSLSKSPAAAVSACVKQHTAGRHQLRAVAAAWRNGLDDGDAEHWRAQHTISCCRLWGCVYPSSSSIDIQQSLREPNNRAVNGCKRVLLIIIFNFPYFDNIPLIKQLYGKAFSKLVFYADVGDSAMGVHQSNVQEGFYQHRTIAQAMHEYPGYDGYMWIADDVMLNYHAVLSVLDASMVWRGGTDFVPYYLNSTTAAVPSWHWTQRFGRLAAYNAYHCLPPKYLRRMKNALGCVNCFVKGVSDVGYVPARFVPDFKFLAYMFREVFFEFAIPSLLQLASPESNVIDGEKGHYSWGNTSERYRQARAVWNPTMHFIHPMKLSIPEQRQDVLDWLEQAGVYYENIGVKPMDNFCR
eukprot:scpid42878/ scgid30364/ 